jgi:hypothetical protein
MTGVTHWNGTQEELAALTTAISRNCTCAEMKRTCPAHQMLTEQRVMNHLAFVRDRADTFRLREFKRGNGRVA